MPKDLLVSRAYVVIGSRLFVQTIRNVPVLAPKNQAFVDRHVREQSLATMAGQSSTEDPQEKAKAEQEKAAVSAEKEKEKEQEEKQEQDTVRSHVKRRKLYRNLTGTEVPWFPHDNDPELIKE